MCMRVCYGLGRAGGTFHIWRPMHAQLSHSLNAAYLTLDIQSCIFVSSVTWDTARGRLAYIASWSLFQSLLTTPQEEPAPYISHTCAFGPDIALFRTRRIYLFENYGVCLFSLETKDVVMARIPCWQENMFKNYWIRLFSLETQDVVITGILLAGKFV